MLSRNRYTFTMNLTFETEQEDDVRWLAEVPEIVGVMGYGATKLEAMARSEVLVLRAFAEQLEHGEFLAQI